MNRFVPYIFCFLLAALLMAGLPLYAQTDSLSRDSAKAVLIKTGSALINASDSAKAITDSARIDTVKKPYIKPQPDTSLLHFYRFNQYLNTGAPVIIRSEPAFSARQKDMVFYILAGVLLLLGLIRLLFAKYFSDLFRIFFQTTFRQKSIREQLLQNKMASLMLNIFFCISGGLFLYFVGHYEGWLKPDGFLQKAALCMALVTVVYFTKYIGLRISGWLFGMKEVAETYLFIVFLINKVVGVLLLPATLILALGNASLQPVLLVVSMILLIVLYLYRYLIALPLVRNHSGLTGFHFFIYLCAFEVVPVLLIYKLLIIILSR